jgi:hypothetical protein
MSVAVTDRGVRWCSITRNRCALCICGVCGVAVTDERQGCTWLWSTGQGYACLGVAVPNRGMHQWVCLYRRGVYMLGCGSKRWAAVVRGVLSGLGAGGRGVG